jgi:hypothetical protein
MGKILKGRLCPKPWNLGFLTYGSSLHNKTTFNCNTIYTMTCKYILTIFCIYHLHIFDFRKEHQWGTFYYTHYIVPVSCVQMTKIDIDIYVLVQSWLLYPYYFFDYHVHCRQRAPVVIDLSSSGTSQLGMFDIQAMTKSKYYDHIVLLYLASRRCRYRSIIFACFYLYITVVIFIDYSDIDKIMNINNEKC